MKSMRLICPNCDAEYEVDDTAIPPGGRDVQCSACGHGWFQTHPDMEAAEEAEAELYDAPDGAMEPEERLAAEAADDAIQAARAAEVRADSSETEDEYEDEPIAPDAGLSAYATPEMPSAAARGLDEQVLAVLKDEAEREVAARRAEGLNRPGLESQTEMPLPEAPPAASQVAGGAESMAAAVKRIAKMRGMSVVSEPAPAASAGDDRAVEADQSAAEAQKTRRKILPAIEEINQSLRSTGERREDDEDAVADTLAGSRAGRGAFRRGFVLVVALAALVIVLYTFAPILAHQVPAMEGAANAYVAAVDEVRVRVDQNLQGLIAWMQGLMGGQSG